MFALGAHGWVTMIGAVSLLLLSSAGAVVAPATHASPRSIRRSAAADVLAPAPAGSVTVEADADAVGKAVWARVEAAAKRAIDERGRFALAIPGGSVLKMLEGTAPAWAAHTLVAYVNHKAVPMDDANLATHAKAMAGFLGDWKGAEVVALEGTSDCVAEACRYAEILELADVAMLPKNMDEDGACDGDEPCLPVFDMMLVGVGDDGHIGSLYPDREEVNDDYSWVLPVEMKNPGSITMSLPVIRNAKEVVVAACGVSEKYPQGKSDAMKRAVETPETLKSFPAAGLRDVATYVFDEAAASKLDAAYRA